MTIEWLHRPNRFPKDGVSPKEGLPDGRYPKCRTWRDEIGCGQCNAGPTVHDQYYHVVEVKIGRGFGDEHATRYEGGRVEG